MKKCLFIYGKHNVDNLFDSNPHKINLHAQWIALKDELYKNKIDLISNESIKNQTPDLELHLNVWNTTKKNYPKFVILSECEFIHPNNINIKLLKKYDHIFSWDPKLSSSGSATKIQLAHPLGDGLIDGFKNRNQLVVLFGSNRSFKKFYTGKNLYAERVKTIRWFEKNAPEDFILYGNKWNMFGRLPSSLGGFIHSIEKRLPFNYKPFPSWKGFVSDKQSILKKTRFSIVYENARGLNGYITEKIFDSFVSGNVPIYWGADDINNHIPEKCFIDRRNFKEHSELYNFLKKMPEEQFIEYQKNIQNFLKNESDQFSCKKFAEVISSKIVEYLK